MPQMAPMNWIEQFIIFTLIFIFMNILWFYVFKNKIYKHSSIKTKSKAWKW